MRYRFLSLVFSILAGTVAVETFRETLFYGILSMVLPPWIFYGVIAVPVIGFISEKRVFSTGYYIALVILVLIPSIQDSELFEGVIDAIYYLGYETLSRSIFDLFPYRDSLDSLFTVTALHLAGIYSENLEAFERRLNAEGYRFTVTPSLFLLMLTVGFVYINLDRISSISAESNFVYALISLLLLSFSIMLIWRLKE